MESSNGELAMKATMEAEVPMRHCYYVFALTVARLALLLRRGGRGEDNTAAG